ncbi:hypothetical protein GUJ93_ZPchr0008g12416 [Zizania palustris]|uniref:Secreted protein n=1 Tax=Zizania palustris TaxID=103762 RepID=A0A8J5RAM7_ZIZPA|nr:hypothetical protein GUJ93_ZPchr0008g12416 [Zizania palustris]
MTTRLIGATVLVLGRPAAARPWPVTAWPDTVHHAPCAQIHPCATETLRGWQQPWSQEIFAHSPTNSDSCPVWLGDGSATDWQ